MKVKAIVFALLSFIILGLQPVAAINIPSAQGYVNDFAQILSPEFRDRLENQLSEYEKRTSIEIAVLTVSSLENQTIENFAIAVFDKWGIGKESQDNGVLLIVAPNEREVRFEVGYGLEPHVTDGRAGDIIRNHINPAFKESNYEKGINDAILQIQEYISAPAPESSPASNQDGVQYYAWIIFAFIYLAAYMARTKSWFFGGIIGFIAGYIVGNWGSIVFLTLFGLFLDYILSKNYRSSLRQNRPTGFWSSGGGFRGSSSGGGFGGFGGGSSGGGGASGKW
ncbi:MAG: TPM domain-containing protein [Patescibacteria group bacterium]|jgi:uncharacterized protein